MIVYEDMCFCGCESCGNTDCRRYLSDAVWEAARSSGLPVEVADFSDHCGRWEEKNERDREVT